MSRTQRDERKELSAASDAYRRQVHYHEGIRDIAVQGASIAEQVRPILMEQMGLDTLRRLDIVFTTEDEVLNGFAMPSNHTVIWVDQNDAALWVCRLYTSDAADDSSRGELAGCRLCKK